MANEKVIWEFLIVEGLTEAGAAGLMGNLYAESGLSPQNLQNSYEKELGYTDATYTAAVDSGKYTDFVHDSAGYGLAQWTYWSRKEGLLKLAQKKEVSIGNLQMQLEYLIWELETNYKAVLSTLKTTDSVKEASDAVLLQFEKPADQSAAVQKKRAEYSQKYYNTFAGGGDSMAYSNSPLVDYTKISPNRNSPRNNKIKKITIHHMAGNMSVESCGASFAKRSRQAQSNYGIGSDGRVGMYVEEKDRQWCSSNPENDHQAVTIEVANDGGAPNWHVSDKALAKLIDLCIDICKRNGIQKLNYTGDKSGNLTMHKWFAATACIPTYTEVLTRDGWKRIDEVQVGEEIACADLDNLKITFEAVYDKVPVKRQDTYTNNELTATKDHRMVYRLQNGKQWKIDEYKNLINKQSYIPLAGYSNFNGIDISDEMIQFLVAVQADGHYMYETLCNKEKGFYGLEFHLKKERKINRIQSILEALDLKYVRGQKNDGSVSIRIYNNYNLKIVDLCELYLTNKCYNWNWINMSPHQADIFIKELLLWDGSISGNKYTQTNQTNLDIVNAIASMNGIGSRIIGDNVIFRKNPYITLNGNTVRNHQTIAKNKSLTTVTCVSVPTGIILIRQHGKTFIVGNCPGPYLESKFPYIAEEVNKRLGVTETKKGWVKSGVSWMWYENGKPVTNCWRKITGDSGVPYWYYLGPGGKMLTGMQKIQGKVYYFNPVAALGVPEGACIITDENGVVNRG